MCFCHTCISYCGLHFPLLFCPVPVLALVPWVGRPLLLSFLHISSSQPQSCPQTLVPRGPEQPVMAVPWGKHHTHLLSQPCPALRRGRGTPHRETGWEHEGAQAGGPPLVGETEWMSRQCPPLSCRLGWSREGPSVTRPRAPLQGGSHPTAPRQRRLPLPPALHTVGPLPSAVVPLSLIAWPDLELHFDAMKTLCLYIMFIYFKDLCQESIFNKNQNDFFSPAGVSSSALTLIP